MLGMNMLFIERTTLSPPGLSGIEENEARRRGLEKFLIRIARHPVLSSTKLFREFLTAKDEKVLEIPLQVCVTKSTCMSVAYAESENQ